MKVKYSSPGYDDIPAWLYKLFANEVSLVVSKTFDTSVAKGFVPDAWRYATVTPVPKSFPVKQNGDLRPISVTSLLCRQLTKINSQDIYVTYIVVMSVVFCHHIGILLL